MRKSILAVSFAIITGTSQARAQNPVAPASFPWEGEATAGNVYVRSGAGTNWYPTTKLASGDRVLVLGEKFGWYQIAPPPQSFSYVEASAVDRKPGGKSGTIKQDKVYVRAGSSLESRKNATQTVLSKGASVEILGEADGFFKVKPPTGACLYVSKQYVRPVSTALRTGLIERHVSAAPQPASTDRTAIPDDPPPEPAHTPVQPAELGAAPTTGAEAGRVQLPLEDAANTSVDTALTSQPAVAGEPIIADAPDPSQPPARPADSPGTKPGRKQKGAPGMAPPPGTGKYSAMLTVVESELADMMRRPLSDQDFTTLIKQYEPIASQGEEFIPAQKAKIRIRQMSDRQLIRQSLAGNPGEQEAIEGYRASMDEERRKIMNRRVEAAMERYDLEGELAYSMAFPGENRRFRLVHRGSDNTLAYVDIPSSVTENPEFLIGRFVGIRTSGLRFSPSARVNIAVATKIVDLTPRASQNPSLELEPAEGSPAPKAVGDSSAAREDTPAQRPATSPGADRDTP